MFKPGDLVVYVRETSIEDSYIKGNKYIVTYYKEESCVYPYIGTQCVITGEKNGWVAEYFKLVSPRKSHLPKWW